MARFLFAVPPFTGHINPTIAVGQCLVDQGHEVAWVGHLHKLDQLLPAGCRRFAVDGAPAGSDPVAFLDALHRRSSEVRGIEGMKFLWEDVLVPLGRLMQAGIERAIDQFSPDVLIADQQALAGGIVARKRGLPWATFGTSSASVVETPLPKVWNWVLGLLADLQRDAGVPVLRRPDISDALMVVFATRELIGGGPYPAHYKFVGPSFAGRREDIEFPFDRLATAGRKILVSLGTVNADRGRRFYQALIDVMGNTDVQVILSAPRALVGDAPANFIVRDYLPQVALLPHVDAVVCHAGQNTVSETLAHGLPLVVVPIKDDQGLVATQVTAAGAAARVRWGRLRAADLERAIRQVLDDGSFRAAARRLQASFATAGGTPRAAELVVDLARRAASSTSPAAVFSSQSGG